MKLYGLTGGIASGKSTVSAMFVELGASVIDADAVYHSLIKPVGGAASELARRVGERFDGVLGDDGVLDRAALGAIVFGDEQARKDLGGITHPAVAAEVARRAQALIAAGKEQVLYDVPLLYENGLQDGMHGVIVVWVPSDVQLARLVARDGISQEQARRRLEAQMSLDEKRELAKWVVDNSGDLDATRARVAEIFSQL